MTIFTPPSAEHIAKSKPICFGANLISVTLVLESTRLVRFTQWLWLLFCELFPDSPTTNQSWMIHSHYQLGLIMNIPISSQIAAVRSNEQVARIWPNSGWAQLTFHTDPACVFQSAVQRHSSFSSRSKTYSHELFIRLVQQGLGWMGWVYLHTLITWTCSHSPSVKIIGNIMDQVFVLGVYGTRLKHVIRK